MGDVKIIFPEPCGEKWDDMAPVGCNRLCDTCDRIILDLAKMTVDEIDAALDAPNAPCVRASVDARGVVRTADAPSRRPRRIVAAVGASASFALAACQSIGPSAVPPRYEITGNVASGAFAYRATLTSDAGKSQTIRLWGSQKFRFGNLKAGTYSLTFEGLCVAEIPTDSIILTDDLDLGELRINDQEGCIVVGVMQRAEIADLG